MIPFGTGHNLPYGFVMDLATATSGSAIKQAIKSFLGLLEDSTMHGFLETPYIDSWLCRSMSKKLEALAQQAVSLEQTRPSWDSIVNSQDDSSVSSFWRSTLPDGLSLSNNTRKSSRPSWTTLRMTMRMQVRRWEGSPLSSVRTGTS